MRTMLAYPNKMNEEENLNKATGVLAIDVDKTKQKQNSLC